MTDLADKALLPAGTNDVLPPLAAYEADKVGALLALFTQRGYERVTPPLFEFEESLMTGGGAATAGQAFRLMDPESRRMMGLRPDMTPQIARIATTRLSLAPRPLRLSYAGDVLRIRGSQMRPERQFQQVGVELIGPLCAEADAEVIVMATEALAHIGIDGLSVDLGIPTLVPLLTKDLSLSSADAKSLRTVLDRKDAAALKALCAQLGDEATAIFPALLEASGPAEGALSRLSALPLPPRAAEVRQGLQAVVDQLRGEAPDLTVTVDVVENRGFEYHSGVSFTLFAQGVRGELGGGGRYLAGSDNETPGEPATGFTLFMDSVLRGLPTPNRKDRVYVPSEAGRDAAQALRAEGWIAIRGLASAVAPDKEAHRLGCTHVLADGDVRPVKT